MKKILTIIAIIATNTSAYTQITTKIVGQIKNLPPTTENVKILKRGDNPNQKPLGIAKINNNKFEITIQTPTQEVCQLVIMKKPGAYIIREFCSFDGKMEISVDCESYTNTTIVGGIENKKLSSAKKYLARLVEEKISVHSRAMEKLSENPNDFYTPQGNELKLKIDSASQEERPALIKEIRKLIDSKKFYSEEFYALEQKINAAIPLITQAMAEYDKKNPSLYRFGEVINNLSTFDYFVSQNPTIEQPLEFLATNFNDLSKAYPTHPYTNKGKELIAALRLKESGKFIDFTAPDLQGNMVRLSDEIKGKIALLDLWASWCGPCREKSVSYIPVYEKYKERGFTVIGVARESKSDKDMRLAIKKDGYEWLNLLELDDREGIWHRYGLSNAAGGVFLIDRKGNIVMEDPSAKELEEYLEENL